MHSPLPGMDPFLESQGFWQDFHFRLLAQCSDSLSTFLPGNYAALIEERVSLVDLSGRSYVIRPDVTIVEGRAKGRSPGVHPESTVATLEPVTLPLAFEDLEEVTERWIAIRRLPEQKLVTVIEVLSPTNKTPRGREDYLLKRSELLRQPVHLVEIDLLLQGYRMPFSQPLPRGDYYTYITRAAEPRLTCDDYAWPLARPLPTIPIPLTAPDPDIPLDLAALVSRAYAQGRYERLVDYKAALDLPLSPDSLHWIQEQIQAH